MPDISKKEEEQVEIFRKKFDDSPDNLRYTELGEAIAFCRLQIKKQWGQIRMYWENLERKLITLHRNGKDNCL